MTQTYFKFLISLSIPTAREYLYLMVITPQKHLFISSTTSSLLKGVNPSHQLDKHFFTDDTTIWTRSYHGLFENLHTHWTFKMRNVYIYIFYFVQNLILDYNQILNFEISIFLLNFVFSKKKQQLFSMFGIFASNINSRQLLSVFENKAFPSFSD